MKLRRALPAIIWTLLIGSTCLIPASSFKSFSFDSILQVDKIVHIIMYVGFVILWYLSSSVWTKKHTILLLFISISYGIVIEILQSSMSLGRHYEVADIIADTIGTILGVLLIPLFDRNMPLIKKYLPFLSKVYQ